MRSEVIDQVLDSSQAEEEDRGNLYAFLAAVFREPPRPELLEAMDAWAAQRVAEEGDSDGVAEAVRGARSNPESTLQDFHDLLKVPTGNFVAPFESAHRGQEGGARARGLGLLMGPRAREVQAHYRAAGYSPSDDCKEPPDHAALELEFMAACASEEAKAARRGDLAGAAEWAARERQFASEHLMRWVPGLCAQMARRARTPFYRAVAQLAVEFLAAEEASLAGPPRAD